MGWHWFKYQDDDGSDNGGKPANKGVYDNYYKMYPYLAKFMQEVNSVSYTHLILNQDSMYLELMFHSNQYV